MSIITLLTDFGESEYPAMMKGVILKINQAVNIIDITHSIKPQSLIEGSFVLKNAVKYFPDDTIHVGVVDPGVGSSRKPIAIKCDSGILIGPDNGLLMPAAEVLGISEIRIITNTDMFLPEISNTFHGRDIFAPTAAVLSKDPGLFTEVGELLDGASVKLELIAPDVGDGNITGTIVHIDRFGNIITNVSKSLIEPLLDEIQNTDNLKLMLDEKVYDLKFYQTYANAESENIIALISSSGHLEFAVPQGSAEKVLKAIIGQKFIIKF